MGGTPSRMKKFSLLVAAELGIEVDWKDYTKGERYGVYKSGPVLCVSVSSDFDVCFRDNY